MAQTGNSMSADIESELLLLSIHPRHAAAILSGKKTVEIRRRVPKLGSGIRTLMYATSPQKAIVGGFRISEVTTDLVESLWLSMNGNIQITEGEFHDYFSGLKYANALIISEPWQLIEPITLSQLRELWPGFHPPRSFRYIRQSDRVTSKLSPLISQT